MCIGNTLTQQIGVASLLQSPGSPPEIWNNCYGLTAWATMHLLQFERQGVVIDRDNLIANIKDGGRSLMEIEEFVRRLVELSSKAKSLLGIYVKLDGLHGDSCPPASALEKLRSKSPSGPQPTFLMVNFGPRWRQHKDCQGFRLLNQLLSASDCYIVGLSLIGSSEWQRFLEYVLHDYTFERLVTLQFRDKDYYTISTDYTNFINDIVSRAPNLQTLDTQGRVDLNLLDGLPQEGSQAVHVTDYPYSPSLDEIPLNAVRLHSLRMTKMKLLGISDNRVMFFDSITDKLLQQGTVSSMIIDLPFLLPLM